MQQEHHRLSTIRPVVPTGLVFEGSWLNLNAESSMTSLSRENTHAHTRTRAQASESHDRFYCSLGRDISIVPTTRATYHLGAGVRGHLVTNVSLWAFMERIERTKEVHRKNAMTTAWRRLQFHLDVSTGRSRINTDFHAALSSPTISARAS
jgi:hypothetical protein